MIFMVGKLVKNTTYSCIWLKTGRICMRWLPLHVIPLMDRLQWCDLTREAAIYLIQLQFAPGSSLEVMTTSADSKIRVVNGDELLHKFEGVQQYQKPNLIFCSSRGEICSLCQ